MLMKRWESPRREGRNHKGKRRSARQRQLKKQTQVWRQKLKGDGIGPSDNQNQKQREWSDTAPFFIACEDLLCVRRAV